MGDGGVHSILLLPLVTMCLNTTDLYNVACLLLCPLQ